MGTALSSHTPTAVVSIDAYVAELLEFTYTGDMGRARFLKTVKTLHREGEAVVKVFIKPSLAIDLSKQQKQLSEYQKTLQNVPNAIGYARILENYRAGYLIRQHIKHNLYDRISTRPFLEHIEKLWIIFQLLSVLKDAHAQNVFHGDIKAENVLVSSWKWIYLADWAPYKPVTLPETDSADFLFYFNTSGRRVCYVAPERFTTQTTGPAQTAGPTCLTAAMDIYSMGCVFAELLMEKPLFSLADSFKYKRGDLEPQLDIEGPLKDLIQSMISIDPKDRLSAHEYFEKFRGSLFPEYFWQLYKSVAPFSRSKQNNSSEMLNYLSDNFDDIIDILGLDVGPNRKPEGVLPVLVSTKKRCWAPVKSPVVEGALIILAIVCSQLVSTLDVSSRLRCLDLLLALSAFVTDEIKLNRSLPYLISLLRDPNDTVQMCALSSLTQLLEMTSELQNLNEKVFTDYLLPRIRSSVLLPTTCAHVKATYAACLPRLAQRAYELEASHHDTLDLHIESHARSLLTEKNSLVRLAVLENFDELCARMGRHSTNDIFLSHTITYLNDRDPQVRKAFFRFIARLGPLVGPRSLEHYVIPLMMQSLVDYREDLVTVVVSALASLVELGLVSQKVLWTMIPQLAKFFIHPNVYIRTRTFILFAAAAKWLTPAQIYCLFRPIIEQVLQGDISDYTDYRCYISAVKPPMPVNVYNVMMQWASESENSLFLSSQNDTNIVFSQEDKRWMERLREVGFNNEELWQLLLYKQYMHQVAKTRTALACETEQAAIKILPQTWTEGEIPAGLEQYIRLKTADTDLGKRLESIKLSPGQQVEPVPAPTTEPSYNGTLVTSVKAHRGAITTLARCDSEVYFVTGADDKLIKVWDSKSVCNGTPRQIHTHDFGSPVKSIQFLRGRSAFVVGTEDSRLHFMELEYTLGDNNISYGPLVVTETKTLAGGYAVGMRHIKDHLYILFSNCAIYQLNLNTGQKWQWQNPVEHGPPTCWCFDRDNEWVAIGTAHGVIDVWDLRFKLLVQSWGVGALQPINCIELHPRTPSRWVIIGGGFDKGVISTWNVQNCECEEILSPSTEDEVSAPEPLIGRLLMERLATRGLKESFNISRAVTAIKASGVVAKSSQLLLSGGTDCIVRFWDLQSPQKCRVISGLAHDHPGMAYSSRVGSSGRITTEKVTTVKTKPARRARLSIIQSEEVDIGRNHRGTITQISTLCVREQQLLVSVDQVGYLKVYI